MYIGSLNELSNVSFTHAGSTQPISPDSASENAYVWNWGTVFDSAVDINFDLSKSCFIGAVCFDTYSSSALASAEVLVDGKLSGKHMAETGGNFSGSITIPVGVTGKKVTLRVSTNLKPICVKDIEIMGSHDDGNPLVWPTPKNITFGMGAVKISSAKGEGDDAEFAASFLEERLCEKFGDWKTEDGVTVEFIKSADMESERYTVSVTEEKITVSASSRLALLWGADVITQICSPDGVRICEVDDKPYMPMRGFHLGLPRIDRFEFVRRLLRYVLIPLRYNHVILEFAGGMRFDSHPKISEKWLEATDRYNKGLQPQMPHSSLGAEGTLLEKDDVRRLVRFAKELGIEVIPEVQSFGHVQYITYAYPEIAELEEEKREVLDTRSEDARPDDFYAHSYCPSMQKSYDIIFDLIDEIVEVVSPKEYVHMGHDEIYQIGLCPRCRDKSPADLYVKHVTAMHDHLAKKGLKMMIWSDMIHHTERYRTPPAIDKLPRDIVMLDFIWYFHFDIDMEDHILPYGYKVVMGNLYSSHYPRFSSRIAKEGMIGGQISMWVRTKETDFADNGKFWDASYTAEMLWSDKYDERLRRTYNKILVDIQKAQRDNIRAIPTAQKATIEKLNAPYGDAAKVPAELLAVAPEASVLTSENAIINEKYDRLIFEHTTLQNAPRIAWKEFKRVGAYIVSYEDGTSVQVPVGYAGNVTIWNRAYATPMPQQYYRHQGYVGTWYSDPVIEAKTYSGDDILVTGYVWENPNPEKVITKIAYEKASDDYCDLVLAGIKGVKFGK